jgi:hypothetical protein
MNVTPKHAKKKTRTPQHTTRDLVRELEITVCFVFTREQFLNYYDIQEHSQMHHVSDDSWLKQRSKMYLVGYE